MNVRPITSALMYAIYLRIYGLSMTIQYLFEVIK